MSQTNKINKMISILDFEEHANYFLYFGDVDTLVDYCIEHELFSVERELFKNVKLRLLFENPQSGDINQEPEEKLEINIDDREFVEKISYSSEYCYMIQQSLVLNEYEYFSVLDKKLTHHILKSLCI